MLRTQLENIALATGQLTTRQVRLVGGMLKELGRLDRRRIALKAAVGVLNPDGDLSTWQAAIALERALVRFNGVSKRRIELGYRHPTTLEINLMTLADSGPQCARKLWTEIREL